MGDVAQQVVPRGKTFTMTMTGGNTRPVEVEGGGHQALRSHLSVSIIMTSYIMMMILGRLLRTKMTAIEIKTTESLFSRELSGGELVDKF